MVTEDYILRMIHDMGRMLARLAGLETENPYAPELRVEVRFGDGGGLSQQLKELADRGEINLAENRLFEELDFSDIHELSLALGFYEYLSEFSDARLELCGYSREEILEGLQDCAAKFGIDRELLTAFQT